MVPSLQSESRARFADRRRRAHHVERGQGEAAVDAADGTIRDLRKDQVACDRLEEAAAELRSQAVSITAHLVVASRLPLPKRLRALLPIRNQVDDVERLSARIGTSAIEAQGHGPVDAGLADIAERLAGLERSRSLLEGE